MQAMVGSALLSSTAGASTVGLFGAGGVLGSGGIITGALSNIGIGSLLSGALTAASAFGQVQAGNMQAELLNMQARQSEIQARNEILRGRQTSLAIKKQLDRDLASASATFAARGFLSGEGSSKAAIDQSRKNATEDINIAMYGANMGSQNEIFKSSQYKSQGQTAKITGYTNAASSLLGGL